MDQMAHNLENFILDQWTNSSCEFITGSFFSCCQFDCEMIFIIILFQWDIYDVDAINCMKYNQASFRNFSHITDCK